MTVLVKYVGGPRAGKTKTYNKNPRTIGCVTEWKAAGIPKGLYKQRKGEDRDAQEVHMVWHSVIEVPGKKPVIVSCEDE